MRQEGGDHHVHEGGDDEVEDLVVWRDTIIVPQQECRHVTDRRPRAPCITGDDADTGILHSVRGVGDKATQDSDDDDCGSEVVKERREEERGNSYTPQQRALIRRSDDLSHGLEAPIGIDRIHKDHRAEDEEECARDVTEVLCELKG